MSDLYDVLGLSRDATEAEIKSAHRREVKLHHPDRGGDREKFERVQKAMVVLSNPERRQRYDETGAAEDIDPVNVRRTQAMNALASKMNTLVGDPKIDPRYVDILVGIREMLSADIQSCREVVQEGRRRITRIEQFARRLKRKKTAGEDPMAALFDGQKQHMAMMIAKAEDDLAVLALAQELAEGYVYKTEQAVPVRMGNGAWDLF